MSAERGYSKAIATTQRWESRNARRKEKRRKSASGGTEPPAGE